MADIKDESVYVEDAASEKDTSMDDQRRGAELFEHERQLPLLQVFKIYPRILLLGLVACSAGLLFGYDQIVNGASISMPSFLLYFGAMTPDHKPYLPSIWTSLWTAMSQLLQALGGLIAGFVADRIGRKYTIMGFSVISAAGVAVQFVATTRGVLLAGKMINGLAIGSIIAVATTWASEISPLRMRAPIQSAIVLFTVLMQAMGLVAVRQNVADIRPSAFRLVFALQWIFCGLTGILFFLVPESPTWLILRNRVAEAKRSVRIMYGAHNYPEARFAHINHEVQNELLAQRASGAGSFLDLYRGSNLKRTLTIHLLFFGVGLAGASFLAQSIYFLIIAGLPPINAFDVSCGGFALAIFTIIASWIYIDRLGRRSLWLMGVAGNFVVMLIIGCLGYATSKAALWAIAILMNLLICWQNTTLTSGSYIITAELSSYRLRSKSQAIAIMSNAITTWLFNFVVPYIYNVDSGNLGAKTGFVFAGASLVLFAASWFVVPNLKDFATDEVDWLYEKRISVRSFEQYNDGRAKDGAAELALQKTRSQGA
ncbi:Sugar (and other) transporter-like protein 12 [Elsinoe fawcettii]|nr:Sugar (and other) transporter-like protein 12 [Elsinoe fawcettii]